MSGKGINQILNGRIEMRKCIARLPPLIFTMLVMIGASMSACAGFLGFGGDSWEEEVLLHDGSKIIVERKLSYGGRHEIGHPPPIKEQTLSFTLPNTGKTIDWTSEYSEDVGRANFHLLALHVLNGTPYIVAEPNLCLSYNKWGRPNPPYVFFKYDGKEWQRIPLAALPAEFRTLNIAIDLARQDVDLMVREGLVKAETIKRRNGELEYNYPQYRSILREAVPNGGGGCIKTDYYKGAGWLSPDWFTDQPSPEACLRFCEYKKIASESCPCKFFFKGAK